MWLVPKFPKFPGPYKVGTIDFEISIEELESASLPLFENDSKIKTVQYRMFYPCDPNTDKEFANWLPNPQRAYLAGYCKLLNFKNITADYLSYIPSPFSFIKIPARTDAPILDATTSNKQWPVMIFSHGLGGTRNTYSFLAGSLSSYGMIIIAPEHRDGSAPITFIRNNSSETKDSNLASSDGHSVEYVKLLHVQSPTVEEGRNSQLRVRLWELGLIHKSLLNINSGAPIKNLTSSYFDLSCLKAKMDIETPGKISFAGHSFGAATITQFVKSTFYSSFAHQAPADYKSLFSPDSNDPIVRQINKDTPVILLDVWCLPLKANETRWLWDRPFPSYSDEKSSGGKVILAIESEAFFKWKEHLQTTKQLLSPNPNPSPSTDHSNVSHNTPEWKEPLFYYAENSAHISQSDFGLLYPSITNKFLGCEEPQRIMMLQVRAMVQFLRNQNIELSPLSTEDKELIINKGERIETDDAYILGNENQVRGWIRIKSTSVDTKSEINHFNENEKT